MAMSQNEGSQESLEIVDFNRIPIIFSQAFFEGLNFERHFVSTSPTEITPDR